MGGNQLIKTNYEFIKILPQWAQDLSYKYCSKTANLYLIHGNIRDYLPHQMNEGEFRFVKVQEYIADVLFGGANEENIIVYFDRSSGISFYNLQMEKKYLEEMRHFFSEASKEDLLSNDPAIVFPYLEKYFLIKIPQTKELFFWQIMLKQLFLRPISDCSMNQTAFALLL